MIVRWCVAGIEHTQTIEDMDQAARLACSIADKHPGIAVEVAAE
ncbi:hypothetical protein PBI_SCHIEBS_24 [Gordonia phage Schiebs]|nr:hypothetical protein PBI_SCHIEBS_24 [Gordonia phage Schiebs]